MNPTQLLIGDYRKSSWSLRAWLLLVTADVAFEVIKIKLEQADTRQAILQYSPSAKVPVLLQGQLQINDSLAIAEYLAETYPDAQLWPADATLRALARAASAEMHAGFVPLRSQLSFGVNTGDEAPVLAAETQADIERVFAIWTQLRSVSGTGPFLCGTFGIVDAMYAPVVLRLRRYAIAVPASVQAYVDAVLAYAPLQQWLHLAAEER